MNRDLGVWTYEDCALVLIDYQREMFEVIRSETGADLAELNVRLLARTAKALDTVDPTPYFVRYGENAWAGVRGYLDAVAAAAATPVIEKYTGVLAAADVFTASTTFHVMQSIRLDLGYGSQVHP